MKKYRQVKNLKASKEKQLKEDSIIEKSSMQWILYDRIHRHAYNMYVSPWALYILRKPLPIKDLQWHWDRHRDSTPTLVQHNAPMAFSVIVFLVSGWLKWHPCSNCAPFLILLVWIKWCSLGLVCLGVVNNVFFSFVFFFQRTYSMILCTVHSISMSALFFMVSYHLLLMSLNCCCFSKNLNASLWFFLHTISSCFFNLRMFTYKFCSYNCLRSVPKVLVSCSFNLVWF